jgi:structural maintenance of chromosome 3 (chondroitin sulfate proteoglycan 6)
LLESAGFSKSNPNFIVQQGKVNTLCVKKDEERLDLLKEVAGTSVYEDKRSESLKIMDDANSKRENIQDIVQQIEDKLNELQEEKDELTAYEQLDKQRRGLEFCLYNGELNNVRHRLLACPVALFASILLLTPPCYTGSPAIERH